MGGRGQQRTRKPVFGFSFLLPIALVYEANAANIFLLAPLKGQLRGCGILF